MLIDMITPGYSHKWQLCREMAEMCPVLSGLDGIMTIRFITALAIWPGLLAAGPYDGVYKQVANTDCSLVGVDGGSVKIQDEIFYGVEMECRMTLPVDVNNMEATLYTMECSGEGQTWSERLMLMQDAQQDGIIMIWDGYVFRYDRCEEGEP